MKNSEKNHAKAYDICVWLQQVFEALGLGLPLAMTSHYRPKHLKKRALPGRARGTVWVVRELLRLLLADETFVKNRIVKIEAKTPWKSLWLCLSLMTFCASAAAGEPATDSPARNSAVWVAPADTVWGLIPTIASGASSSKDSFFRYFTGTVGLNLPVGSLQLGLSASFTSHVALESDVDSFDRDYSLKARGGALTAGPIFHPFSGRGWFVQPKIVLGAYWAKRWTNSVPYGTAETNETWSLEAVGGFNVGWERNFGRFYLAFSSGIGLGYSSNRNSNPFSGMILWSGGDRPSPGLIVNVDLNFFRLGVAF